MREKTYIIIDNSMENMHQDTPKINRREIVNMLIMVVKISIIFITENLTIMMRRFRVIIIKTKNIKEEKN